ncbi:MAG TPA: N-6 DNA methylase [Roseiflexaceae bacterium]|nr:N-6 DNA methylase [Roseiflexaceae bacterium]
MPPPPPSSLVALLYERARRDEPLAAQLAAWHAFWEFIHGRPGRKRPLDTAHLATPYGLGAAAVDLPALLYAMESCFVFRTRALAYAALSAATPGAPPLSLDTIARMGGPELRALAGRILASATFTSLGMASYGGAELFDFSALVWDSMPVEILRAELAEALRQAPVAQRSDDDPLRAAYHRLLPRQLRHGLGAYYTPPWLAEYVVETLWGWLPDGTAAPRAIDPACGSGVFLLAALRQLTGHLRRQGFGGAALVRVALRGVAGLDINPLAVQAARANLALFLARLLAEERCALDAPVELPIALRDGLDPQWPAHELLAPATPPPDGPFDMVVGNPPWVNWEYLPPAYRERTRGLWAELGLFALRGREKAFSKEDISALFAYAACERYLGEGGLLGFLLPQSLLKSSLNGRGFRRMRLGARALPLQALQVDDLVAVRPFEGIGNRPMALFLRKGSPTAFPTPYRRWAPAGPRRALPPAARWGQVRGLVTIAEGLAWPADPHDPGAPWVDGPAATQGPIERLSGACPYRARTGMFTGGANGVYYVELIEQRADGLLRVRNLAAGARRGVAAVEAVIEPEHVYPLLRGREVGAWAVAGSALVICPHTAAGRMAAVPPEELRVRAPLTYAYLEQFRAALEARRGFSGWEERFRVQAFYACQRIGAYTFAPYKVAWRYIASTFRCAVVEPGAVGAQAGRPVIPHEKLMIIPFEDADEAYFVCSALSSSPARLFVERRMVETQIAPHVIARLALPRYNASDARHRRLAALCRTGHTLRRRGDERGAQEVQRAIDDMIVGVLPLSAADVAAARAALGVEHSSKVLPL